MVDRINSLMVGAWLAARDGFKREEGQAMAEYALILAVIAVGVIAVLVTLQGGISSKLSDIASKISGAK